MQFALIMGTVIAVTNVIIYQVLDSAPIEQNFKLMLGYVTLATLCMGMYIGLRRLRYLYSRPIPILHSLGYGGLIALGAAVCVILLRVITTALKLTAHENVTAYFHSPAPVTTLVWYTGSGIVCCLLAHFIIQFQYRNTLNKSKS